VCTEMAWEMGGSSDRSYHAPIDTAANRGGTGPRFDPKSPWPICRAKWYPAGSSCHYSHDPSRPALRASTNRIVMEPYITDHG
jgi:hypothetical protein